MTEIMQDIANLEQQERIFQGELLKATTSEQEQAIQSEINSVQAKLTEKRAALAQAQQYEQTLVEEVAAADSTYTLSVGGYEVDFRSVTETEEQYQALTIAVRLKLAQMEQQAQTELAALKASYDAEIANEKEKHADLYEEYNQARIERNDLQAKWEAAANERNELATENEALRAEIDSYKAQVTELRSQVSKSNAPTNLDNSVLAEAIRNLNASKPAVYNLREKDGHYLANLAETDEEIHINWIEKGKYRVLSEDEAARFRQEREAAKETPVVESPAVTPEPSVEIEVPSFQDEDTGHDVAETPSGEVGQVDAETIEARVARLEIAVFGQAKVAA